LFIWGNLDQHLDYEKEFHGIEGEKRRSKSCKGNVEERKK